MMSLPSKSSGLIVMALAIALSVAAPFASVAAEDTTYEAETAAALQQWQASRFGLFIHWAPVSLRGVEISWSRGNELSAEDYDALYKQFNPAKFDGEEWARIAKAAGTKYVVFTSKHHDGFCFWPTKLAGYHIGETPFRRDIIRELSTACRADGLQFSLYYSLSDWRGPDYGLLSPGGSVKNPHANMPRHFELVKAQTRELLKEYGPLGCLWYDGDWEEPWTREYGDELYRDAKSVQPSVLVNNRVSKGRVQKQPDGKPAGFGDFDTPEQRIGGFDREHYWESCFTLCTKWGWVPNDPLKSLDECLATLVRTVGGDGNLLLNVGPTADGQIEPRQAERLGEIGSWLAKYGDGIYGTRGGPFRPGIWGASTCRDDHIYLYVLKWPERGPLRLPAINQEIVSVKARSGGMASVNRTERGIELNLPVEERDASVTVIELTVSGRAFDIAPRRVTLLPDSLVFDRPTRATNVFQNEAEYNAEKATDDDPSTRWATDTGLSTIIDLEVDFAEASIIEHVAIEQPLEYQRIRSFEIDRFDGQDWILVCRGKEAGQRWTSEVEPALATRVRLRVFDAANGPTISEFQVFGHAAAEKGQR